MLNELRLIVLFQLEYCLGCTCDQLMVYTKNDSFGPFCGDQIPGPFDFEGEIVVTLVTDVTEGRRGFEATFGPRE